MNSSWGELSAVTSRYRSMARPSVSKPGPRLALVAGTLARSMRARLTSCVTASGASEAGEGAAEFVDQVGRYQRVAVLGCRPFACDAVHEHCQARTLEESA